MNEEMFFGISEHTIAVVGQDGAYTKPITMDYIMITPGQTMDVLLTANQASGYYYMNATPFADSGAPYDTTNTSAILVYTSTDTPPNPIPSPSLPNATDRDAAEGFTSQIIKALASTEHPVDVPQNITKRIVITVSVNHILCPEKDCGGPGGDRHSASLNNISFENPSIDILHSYYWYYYYTALFFICFTKFELY
jgi:laccase